MSDICGSCKIDYANKKDYLAHVCEVSGFNPTQPEHSKATNDADIEAVSNAALARGNKRKELESQGKTPEEAIEETRKLGSAVK